MLLYKVNIYLNKKELFLSNQPVFRHLKKKKDMKNTHYYKVGEMWKLLPGAES